MALLINSKIAEAIQNLIKTVDDTAKIRRTDRTTPRPIGKILDALINVENYIKRAEKAANAAKDSLTIAEYNTAYVQEWNKPYVTDEYKRFTGMTHPIQNTVCGHYYDKTLILQNILANPMLRCPVTGCESTEVIKKENLIEDDLLSME